MKLAGKLPRLREGVISAIQFGDMDWRRTKAFCDGTTEDIWINLKGRDPLGTVEESEYDALCDFLCSELRSAVDVVSGKPIVEAVFRRDQVYHGPHIDRSADITFRWKTDMVITGIKTNSLPKPPTPVTWTWPAERQTGGHALNGVVMAAGPRIAAGVTLSDAELIDIAPTILYCFGNEVPADFDGKVIEQMFKDDYLAANPPSYGAGEEGPGAKDNKDIFNEEDSELIEQRLKDLGLPLKSGIKFHHHVVKSASSLGKVSECRFFS